MTLECRIFSLQVSWGSEAPMNPTLIFAELGERQVQAISFYLCTRKYWKSSPDSKFFCLTMKHHFVTLECQIYNLLTLRLLCIQLDFCRIGWERGARLQAISFCWPFFFRDFRIQTLSSLHLSLWGHTLSDSQFLLQFCQTEGWQMWDEQVISFFSKYY